MTQLDVNALANAKAKGKRPYFFDDPAVERVLAITMAVAGELAVMHAAYISRILRIVHQELEALQAEEISPEQAADAHTAE